MLAVRTGYSSSQARTTLLHKRFHGAPRSRLQVLCFSSFSFATACAHSTSLISRLVAVRRPHADKAAVGPNRYRDLIKSSPKPSSRQQTLQAVANGRFSQRLVRAFTKLSFIAISVFHSRFQFSISVSRSCQSNTERQRREWTLERERGAGARGGRPTCKTRAAPCSRPPTRVSKWPERGSRGSRLRRGRGQRRGPNAAGETSCGGAPAPGWDTRGARGASLFRQQQAQATLGDQLRPGVQGAPQIAQGLYVSF